MFEWFQSRWFCGVMMLSVLQASADFEVWVKGKYTRNRMFSYLLFDSCLHVWTRTLCQKINSTFNTLQSYSKYLWPIVLLKYLFLGKTEALVDGSGQDQTEKLRLHGARCLISVLYRVNRLNFQPSKTAVFTWAMLYGAKGGLKAFAFMVFLVKPFLNDKF